MAYMNVSLIQRVGLSRLLDPHSIAVVGASAEAKRIGGQLLRNLIGAGYAGSVYAVNPKYCDISEVACFSDLTALPQPCDPVLIAVNDDLMPGRIKQCGAPQDI